MDIPPEIALAVPAIGVLLAVARTSFGLPDRYTPAVAVALGVAVGIFAIVTTPLAVLPGIVGGVMAGGTTVGLHQVGKQLQPPPPR